jgi:Glycosyl hydrolases family 15
MKEQHLFSSQRGNTVEAQPPAESLSPGQASAIEGHFDGQRPNRTRLKIAIVSPEVGPGAGVPHYWHALSKVMAHRHDVHLFTARSKAAPLDGIEVHRFWAVLVGWFLLHATFYLAVQAQILVGRLLRRRPFEFLADFRDQVTGLPLPSQDLWEERQGVHAFTVAAVWRALHDAAFFTELFHEPTLSKRYLEAASGVRKGAEAFMYNASERRFARSVVIDSDGRSTQDMVVDASLWALPYFGMFEPDDPRIVSTMDAVQTRLTVPGDHGGLARVEGDTYQLRDPA